MKAVFFGSIPPRWGGPKSGGVASYNRSLVQAIAAHSQVITKSFVVPNTDPLMPSSFPPQMAISSKACSPARGDAIADYISGADVAVFHHLMNPAAGLFVKECMQVPSVCVVHSWTTFYKKPHLADELQRRMDAMDAVVFPSLHCIAEGRQLGFSISDASSVIYSYVENRGTVPSALRRKRRNILFAGQLLPVKQPDILIRAAKYLPEEVSISIAGAGPLLSELGQLVQREGLGERVEFLGDLPHETLIEKMASAAVLCVPSERESFGLVYIEALSSGTPIVGFSPSIEEISDCLALRVGGGHEGDNVAQLVSVLEKVLRTNWDHERLATATNEYYSPSRMASRFDDVIKSLRLA
jgi:glycosyltransferase involved in cell wall biosynthesis